MIRTSPLPEGQSAEELASEFIGIAEDTIAVVHADANGAATIGTGFNLTDNNSLTTVLNHFGVFEFSDEAELIRRQQQGEDVENQTERDSRYRDIVLEFSNIISGAGLPNGSTSPGSSQAEMELQSELNDALRNFGPPENMNQFILTDADSRAIVTTLLEGLTIGPGIPTPDGTPEAFASSQTSLSRHSSPRYSTTSRTETRLARHHGAPRPTLILTTCSPNAETSVTTVDSAHRIDLSALLLHPIGCA